MELGLLLLAISLEMVLLLYGLRSKGIIVLFFSGFMGIMTLAQLVLDGMIVSNALGGVGTLTLFPGFFGMIMMMLISIAFLGMIHLHGRGR